MKIALSDVQIKGNTAQCTASIGLITGDMPPLEYVYELAKTNGKWAVTTSKQKAGTSPHGGMMPAGHPAMDGQAGAPTMPSHQPSGGGSK
ncbi:MAG: hypothetical protein P8Z49_11050 [Acidobacteriota bacterium]